MSEETTATLKPIMHEVGTGEPGYRWVQRWNVVHPDGKSETFLLGTLAEAKAFCQERGWVLGVRKEIAMSDNEKADASKATGRPWHCAVGGPSGRRFVIEGPKGEHIAYCQTDRGLDCDANAKLIVRAVNAHAALLGFAQRCADDKDDRISPGLKAQALQALAAAQGGVS